MIRILCVLPAVLAVLGMASCSDNKPEPESVDKYCVLTSLPHETAPQLKALHKRGVELFEQKKPYKVTPANKRVINAATQLTTTARTGALQLENPKLFPGFTRVAGLDEALKELTIACARLPKTKP